MKLKQGMVRNIVTSAALLPLALGLGANAAAQEAAGADEIIVLAQKRAENIQDVPISVTALSGEALESAFAGGADILALAGRAPGLNVESSNGRAAPRFYIRGLGNADFDLSASQPVSVIMDDVVMENVALKSFPLFDVAQIEVLRGPQGTLYGRNTPAGIVHIRTARPTEAFEALLDATYGSHGSATVQGAVSGPLIAGVLAGRASAFLTRRDDWIDNAFTGEDDALGGFEDIAGRVQLLYTPTGRFSALLNLQTRSLEGTSSVFRANIFDVGSNQLNGNFDRDKVYFDAGDNNPQEYDNDGAALTLDYDFDGMTLTSITAYQTAEGRSLGDIDGGNLGGPGFIPFPSETQDKLEDLEQVTQEIRLASASGGVLTWQLGAYYFESSFDVNTVGPGGFPPSTTVRHENTSWAVFGQAGYKVLEDLTLALGVRYTEDEKDMSVPLGPAFDVSVEDEQVSWDLSATYEATPDVNLFARIASGFRAPSILGRDIAFFNPPSVADSETITSYEAGIKSDVLGGTGRINATIYYYEIEDQQFAAIGGLGNFNQLINADKGEGYGFEIEALFDVTENFLVTGGFAYNHTEIKDSDLAVGGCAQCTITDPLNGAGFALVDGNPFPNAPEFTMDLTARYAIPTGDGGEFFAFTDWVIKGETNFFLYESVEFQTETQIEGGLKLGYARQDGAYEIALFARNLTDEENVIGAIDFNNLTGFVNEPRIIGVSLSARY